MAAGAARSAELSKRQSAGWRRSEQRGPASEPASGLASAATSYEVGPEFPQRFLAEDPASRLLSGRLRAGHFMFDLPGYIEHRLARAGCRDGRARLRTTRPPRRADFFSYRRGCLRGEGAYGRGLSAIALTPDLASSKCPT